MPLDANAARDGIVREVGNSLAMEPVAAALGVVRVAVAKMSLAVRGVSVERGYDPRDFALVAMGGAGPLHAIEIARDLRIPTVVVPNLPAHFSALGMLLADVRHDYVRTYYRPLREADFAAVLEIFRELEKTGAAALAEAGVPASVHEFQLWMDLRYVGQEFWLQIPVSESEVRAADAAVIEFRFGELHDQRFGHAAQDEPLELVNLRLTATGKRPTIAFARLETGKPDSQTGTRAVYLEHSDAPVECAVHDRTRLNAGQIVEGPAVIEEYASTTVLFEGDRLVVADTGELMITVRSQ
jgi:N-methylhydantoinase A